MRLIDADAFWESVSTDYWEHYTRCHSSDQIALMEMIEYCLNEQPTIEARPVVRGEWISVEERLPEIVKTTHAWKNTYRKSGRVLCACLQADGKQMVKEGYMEFFNDYPKPSWRIPGTIHSVTHWMPLPEPPNCGADMRGTTE